MNANVGKLGVDAQIVSEGGFRVAARSWPMKRELLPPHVVNIDDLRRLARTRLPKVVFDYLDGGAEDELTLQDNTRAFRDVSFVPQMAIKTPVVDLTTRVLGLELGVPMLLAPIGYSRLMHPSGELAAASGAANYGTGNILATISGHALEKVAALNKMPNLQLYLLGDRQASKDMLARARSAGFKSLFVTIDTPVAGMRERDFRNGMKQLMGRGIFPKLPFLPDIAMHPRWLAGYLFNGGMQNMPNVVLADGPMRVTDVSEALESAQVTWDDFAWIRDAWPGPIVIKGVHTAEDARKAAAVGADAIVVSNHGGRQLDGVPGSLRTLPGIVEAVGGSCEVLFDGGIRRGSDIIKALCLGAKAVLIGRAYAYGMAAAGQDGVDRAMEILHADMVRVMKLLGCHSIAELTPERVKLVPEFRDR